MIVSPTPENVDRAAGMLRDGELVSFPTETVYGLGADARNPDAVRRVFAAKRRPAEHPVIVHIADASGIPLQLVRPAACAQDFAARRARDFCVHSANVPADDCLHASLV